MSLAVSAWSSIGARNYAPSWRYGSWWISGDPWWLLSRADVTLVIDELVALEANLGAVTLTRWKPHQVPSNAALVAWPYPGR